MTDDSEEQRLRAAALKNVEVILAARQRAERDLVAAKDALERRTSELQQQREWFEVTLASIGDAVITTDVQARVTFLNPIAETMTGWALKDALGKPLADVFKIINEDTRAAVESPIDRVLATGQVVGLANHTSLVAADGTETAIEDSAAPIRDSAGKVAGAVMVFHDVTRRRRAERALRASEERLRAIFAQAAVGIAVADVEGRFLEANQKFCSILGFPLEELRGHTFLELTHPDDAEATRIQVRRLVDGVIPNYALEKRYVRKDGTTVWSSTTVTLLRREGGVATQFLGVIEDITERKQAQELRERFAAIVEHSDDAIITKTLDSIVTTWNPAAEHIFGYTAAEIIGKPITILIPDNQLDEEPAIIERLKRGERIDHYETIRRRKDGALINVSITVSPLKDAAGKIMGAAKIARDITRQKHAEVVRERLAAVVESTDDAIVTKTLEGVITTWNPGAQRLFGYTPEEAIGKPVTILIPPQHENEEPQILQRLRRGERIDHYETVRRHKDGSFLDVSLTVSPLKDVAGNVIGASKIARDITRQKHAEQVLREQANVLSLLDTTGKAIGSKLDLEKVLQTVTDVATQLSGAKFGAFFYNVTNSEGESFLLYTLSGAPREAFEKFGLPRNTPVFHPTFTGQGVVRSADITKDPRYGQMSPHFGMPKGHLPVRSYLAAPVTARTGEVIGGLFFGHPDPDVFTAGSEKLVVGVAAQAAVAMDNARLYEAAQRELDSRERAEAALRETDRRKDEFLATLAHELRNPLAPIRQATMISRSPAATEEQKRWSHEVISRQVHHMSLLLDDLLDVSRITRGTLALRIQMAELASIVEAAVEQARPLIDAKQHQLTRNLPTQPVRFAGDPLRLAQVLSNLLTNAAKYTDRGGRILLRATADEDSVTISVTDTGVGLAEDAIPTVFTMFSQVKGTQDRSEGGLGIGLALAKGLMELHGGSISARSAGIGSGSEFTMHIPRTAAPQQPDRAAAPVARAAGAPRAHRVLIADDNRDAADSLALLLGIEGHEVTVATNGSQALELIAAEHPDIALLDIGMPLLDGHEVARRVRANPALADIVLVAITGWGQESDKVRARDAGFDLHFTKPIEPQHIIDLLRSPDLRGS